MRNTSIYDFSVFYMRCQNSEAQRGKTSESDRVLRRKMRFQNFTEDEKWSVFHENVDVVSNSVLPGEVAREFTRFTHRKWRKPRHSVDFRPRISKWAVLFIYLLSSFRVIFSLFSTKTSVCKCKDEFWFFSLYANSGVFSLCTAERPIQGSRNGSLVAFWQV